ncbi:transcriptional regulator GcvA [Curvivirga sp.]|uniref:transcriptional regulator GcvA n=1 Tax=Curvivirga sp. TaxID=2856848 RepID=UPI003B59148F
MKRRIPPLKSVRVFEAAARLLSFSKAADELHVTHGAVSQQIKILEEFYDTSLFIRSHARVSLTTEGQKLLPVTTEILDNLSKVTDEILKSKTQETLTINLTSAFASHWLMPRLNSFQQQYPDITIRLAPSARFRGFETAEFDIAIRWGKSNDTSLVTTKIFDVDAFAACAPSFIKENLDLKSPGKLKSSHLIHDDTGDAWAAWFEKANIPAPDFGKGSFYADSSLALQAAVTGQGIITAGSILAHADLEAGRLIIPYDLFLPRRNAYYLSYPKPMDDKLSVKVFKEWILAEAETYLKAKPSLHKFLY